MSKQILTDDILDSIHSLIPEDFRGVRRGMTEVTQRRIRRLEDYMRRNCLGKENAKPTSVVALECGFLRSKGDMDSRSLSARMAALTRAMIILGIPVCSVTGGKKELRGIYLATSREEIEASVRYIAALGLGDIVRARQLSKCVPVRP